MTDIWYRDPSGGLRLAQGDDVRPGNQTISYLSPHSEQYHGRVRRHVPAAWVERIDGPVSTVPLPQVDAQTRAGIDAYYERHRLAGTDSGD